MRFFHKKSHPPAGAPSGQQQALHLARAIARRQQHVALLLSERFERLPLQARKAIFLSFCLLLGSASGWILLQATRPDAGALPADSAGELEIQLPPAHTPSSQAAPDSLVHADV